jgi:serine/threonine protein kinase
VDLKQETGKMKASVLFGPGWENDSLELLWREAGRAFCRLWRDDGGESRYAFIPISSGVEHPALESVNRLTQEHELNSYLDSSWALRPLELVRERGQTILVVDYTGGEPLDRLVREPMEIGQFLRLSVALSSAIGQLHGRGLIHKDLKPANVLVDSTTGRVRLTGFGIASRLPRERQSADRRSDRSGTLITTFWNRRRKA